MSPSGAGRIWWVIIAAVLLIFSIALSSCSALPTTTPKPTETPIPADSKNISVTVIGVDGTPLVNGVVVRVTNSTESDGDDHDSLNLDTCMAGQYITAWAPGYQAGFTPCDGLTAAYSISLLPLVNRIQDNPNYPWLSAYGNCSPCHAGQLSSSYNEIGEWEFSAHAKVFKDPFFKTMYRGTDISGISGPPTQWVFMGNKTVRKVDTNAPGYKGPGFQLDLPGQAGNCAYCHAPAAILSSRAEVEISPLFSLNGDTRTEGITCDVCHKVNGVIFSDNTYPFENRPGVLSFQFLRSDSFRTGPFTNIVAPSATISMCSEIFSSSDFCAPCHYGKFGDTQVYNSYGEWRSSSYASNAGGDGYRTCQDCHMSHMQSDNKTPYARRSACSETEPGFQDFSHNLMDFGLDPDLQRNIPRMIRGAATIEAGFEYKPDKDTSLQVHMTVRNTRAGHKFPTDSPLRHLILVLDAKDQFGNTLLQVDGPQIPNWGGINNAYMEASGVKGYAGLPGKIFANLLIEEDINLWPSAAYWNETKPAVVKKDDVISDNRLQPDGKDESDYYFSVPDDGEVRFKISLIYRFGFYDLMQQKRWVDLPDRRDIPVMEIECHGNKNRPNKIQCDQTDP